MSAGSGVSLLRRSALGTLGGFVALTTLCVALTACGTTGHETAARSTPAHRTASAGAPTSNARSGPASHSGPDADTRTGQATSSTRSGGLTEDFCTAVAAINEIPDSDTLSSAERAHALQVIDNLLRLWPAETKAAAQTYFGELRKAVAAGTAVDLDNTSKEFQEAFAVVFQYAADTCPGGFG